MKKGPSILFYLLLSAAAAAQLPKVAVLDTVLTSNVDKSVSMGVSERISEELVASGKYVVLDRTTVGQSLKEIEFQMSGLVSDEELQKAGDQLSRRLGASIVVIAQVSLVSGTYFISVKMIDVATGEIVAQASDQEVGKASVTLQIAQRAARKLASARKAPTAVQGSTGEPAAEVRGASVPSGTQSAQPASAGADTWKRDQGNMVYGRSSMNCGGSSLKLTQGFTPAMSRLAAIDLLIQADAESTLSSTTLSVRSGSPIGPVVGVVTLSPPLALETDASGVITLRFEFDPPVALAVGSRYVIEWAMPQKGFSAWRFSGTNAYPGGVSYNCSGIPTPANDFCFTTWALR
jgi:hypothetical protein